MAGEQIKVIIASFKILFFMADEQIFNHWSFGLNGNYIKIDIIFNFDRSWGEIEFFEMNIEKCATHCLRFPCNNLSIDHALLLLWTFVVSIHDLVDRKNFISLK